MDVYKEWLGIPEGERPPDHYTLLRCVRFEDDVEKVRNNYRKLNAHVRKYATGQYSNQSQELLNELAKAMLCLTDAERKREYDEGQGRVFDNKDDVHAGRPMGDVLVQAGKFTRDQLREAESFAEARGLSMRDAVVQLKLVDQETAGKAYAQELGLSFVDLADMAPDDSILDQFPRNFVKRNSILPLFVDNDMLLVAVLHEPTHELEEEVRLRCGHPMRPVIATPLALNQGMAKYYAPGMRETAESKGPVAGAAGKKGGKAETGASSTEGRKPWSKLDEGERQQRKQYGILIMCWSIILSVLLDQFVLIPLLLPKWSFVLALSLVIPPIAISWVLKSYWK